MMDISAERGASKLTQAELAAKLGVHQTTVMRWEKGELTPNSRDLIAIRTAIDALVAERNGGEQQDAAA